MAVPSRIPAVLPVPSVFPESRDKKAFAEAIDYYQSALKIYENKKLQQEISIVNSSMDKVMKAWRA